jgi:hypothetical protein
MQEKKNHAQLAQENLLALLAGQKTPTRGGI